MKLISRLTAVAGLLFVCASAAADETAPELVARYEKLTLGAPAVSVSNMVITSGSMKLTLANGVAAPVKAGDEVIGTFFKGDGSFDYAANDAVELPIMQTNLRNTKSKATLANGVLHGTFNEALIAAQSFKLPELQGAAASDSLADAFTKHRAIFTNDQETQLATLFALHKLIAPLQRNVRAELRGDEEWVYSADHEDEVLSRLYTIDFEDRPRRAERYEAPISAKPVGRTRLDVHPYDYVLSNIDYAITASGGNDLTVTATETLLPRTNGVRGLGFYLIDKTYPEDLKAARHYAVKSITTEDGKAVPYYHGFDTLIVSLPQPTMAASPIKLKFELAGDILYREGGDNQWLLRMGWFPLAPRPGTATTAHGLVKVKAPFVPFTGGKTIRRATEGDYNVVETQIDHPVDFVAVTAGKYSYEEEKRGNVTIRTGTYGQKNPRAAKKINGLAFDIIQYYEYFLGPFPEEELNILEMNDLGWGQAPSGLVFITSEAFQPLLGTLSQLYSEGINERIAHEIAHQYFGGAVRSNSFDEQWLDESFAEYSAALLLKKFQGDAPYKRLLAHWKADANESHKLAPIPLANRITTPNNEDWNRFKLLYGKGPYLLAALHKQVGEEPFLVFLKSYQKSFHYKAGSTKDVIGLLGFMTKTDFKPFFDKYYWGTEVPEIK